GTPIPRRRRTPWRGWRPWCRRLSTRPQATTSWRCEALRAGSGLAPSLPKTGHFDRQLARVEQRAGYLLGERPTVPVGAFSWAGGMSDQGPPAGTAWAGTPGAAGRIPSWDQMVSKGGEGWDCRRFSTVTLQRN